MEHSAGGEAAGWKSGSPRAAERGPHGSKQRRTDPWTVGCAVSLRAAVGSDFRAATWAGRVALLAVCGWLAYEWGPGNEAVTPWLLIRVLDSTEGWWAVAITAAVGFTFTATQQFVSGLTALAGFSMFDRTATAARETLRRKSTQPAEWRTLSMLRRALLVFSLGTTAVALVQIVSTGRTGVRRHVRVIAASAVLCGFLVAVIGGAVAALLVLAEQFPSTEGSARWLIRVLGSPVPWLVLAAVAFAGPLLSRRSRIVVGEPQAEAA